MNGTYYYCRFWNDKTLSASEVDTLYTHRAQIGWDAVVAAISATEPESEPDYTFSLYVSGGDFSSPYYTFYTKIR